MAKIKNVVKVMNFHSLLRVDMAKKRAEKYFLLEKEIMTMIDVIINNQNFILDKKIMLPASNKQALTIYFGSDYGFCSNYNTQISEMIRYDDRSTKIILGKKMARFQDKVIMQCSKDEFEKDAAPLLELIKQGVKLGEFSEVYIVFNRYTSVTDIKIEKKKVYPIEIDENNNFSHQEDFTYEGDISNILQNMLLLYLEYQLKICDINTTAAENILRQNATKESLKRIDEREEQSLKEYRKAKKAKDFRKVIETFSKQKSHRG